MPLTPSTKILALSLSFVLLFTSCPQARAEQKTDASGLAIKQISSYDPDGPTLPLIEKRVPRKTMVLPVTAYNSEPGQTDDTPFITAFGTHVRDGIVATNFLPKGTLVRFPELYPDKIFVVEDRMNARYYYHLDIWMAEKQAAVNFGLQVTKVEIL